MSYFNVVWFTLLLHFIRLSSHHSSGIGGFDDPDWSPVVARPVRGGKCVRVNSGFVSWPLSVQLCRSSTYIYKPRTRKSVSAVLVAILLLRAGLEQNPGPITSQLIYLGSVNTRSAINKAALLHSIMAEESLDVLALSETWVACNDPPCNSTRHCSSGFSNPSHTSAYVWCR